MSIEFLLTSIAVILLPGTGVLYTLSVGLGRGFRASIAAAFGCTLGIVPAALASIVGLAAIFHTSVLLFNIVKIVGVLYLFWMAWTILRDDGAVDVDADSEHRSLVRTALSGLFLNVFNPKLSLFFLSFLPQFVQGDPAKAGIEMALLAGVFMVLTFVAFVGYGSCAALARDYVIRRSAAVVWMKRSFAAAFGFLGLRLALAETPSS